MSKYTTEVRFLCESESDLTESTGFNNIETVLTASAPKIFNFDFPIFDNSYKLPLEKKILRHYYTREISEETVGLWKLRLCDKLNMIMPYYNQLYKSALIEFDPFLDVNLSSIHNRKGESTQDNESDSTDNLTSGRTSTRNESGSGRDSNNGTNTSNSTQLNDSTSSTKQRGLNQEDSKNENSEIKWDLYSDTPQGDVNGVLGIGGSGGDKLYLTTARKLTGDSTDETKSIGNSQNDVDSSEQSKNNVSTIDQNSNASEREYQNSNNEVEQFNSNRDMHIEGNINIKNTEDYIEKIVGKRSGVSYSSLLAEFRKTFLNIDAMVIEELKDLFFGLWE